MLVEKIEYDTTNGLWTVWGVISKPNLTVSGAHTVEAPEYATEEEVVAILEAQYVTPEPVATPSSGFWSKLFGNG